MGGGNDQTMEIDPIEYGKLIQAVETLTKEVTELRGQIDGLKSSMSKGRGMLFGLLLAAGVSGAGITSLVKG